MKNSKKNDNFISIPTNPREEETFRYLESDECLGSWMLGEEVTFTEKIKYNLCQNIVRYKRQKKLNLAEIAEQLELDGNMINKLLHYHLESFALDSLIGYVEKLQIPCQVKIVSQKARV